MMQKHFSNELGNFMYFNDDKYTSGYNCIVDMFGYGFYDVFGEGDECAISQILFRLTDNRNYGHDVFEMNDILIFDFLNNNAVRDFCNFYLGIQQYMTPFQKEEFAQFLIDYNITPYNIQIINEFNSVIPPILSWDIIDNSPLYKFNFFEIEISSNNGNFSLLLNSNQKNLEIPTDSWDQLVFRNCENFSVCIKAYLTEYYETGPYSSMTYIFDIPENNLNSLQIMPNDFGFPESYGSETGIITRTHVFYSRSITTIRKRCGFIENEYINLSARKQNFGVAFIEFHLEMPIRRLDLNLSFWSDREYLSSDDSIATIDILDFNNEWLPIQNLLDGNLPTDRTNQKLYSFIFNNPILSFRIYVQTEAVGTYNKGRISIGNITMYYEN